MAIINASSLPRLDRDGQMTRKRALTLNPEGINALDCLKDQRIRLTLQMTGFEPHGRVEAWASLSGAQCGVASSRKGNAAMCWRLFDEAIPLQSITDVDVRVRRILSGIGKPPQSLEPARDEDVTVCSGLDRTTVSLVLLYFRPQEDTASMMTSVDVQVDTLGNPPPIDLRALPGDGRVRLDWTETDKNATQIHVYCTPIEGSGSQCASEKLQPGSTLDLATEASLRCASLVGMGTAVNVSNTPDGKELENGKTYLFAAASVDPFGNLGPLSQPTCETPRPGAVLPGDESSVEGGCAASPTAPASGASAMMIAIAGVLVRRRRRTARQA